MEITDAWIALIGTIFGGVGLKAVERWLNRSKERDEAAAKYRDELREEVYRLREELRKADADIDKWREDYFNLKNEFITIKLELAEALRLIKERTEKNDEVAS